MTPYLSTLALVMACCLTVPSHYLNQCWVITKGILWYPPRDSWQEVLVNLIRNIYVRGLHVNCYCQFFLVLMSEQLPEQRVGWPVKLHKQRVLMHRHQGWNVRHGLCHIYMIYIYIWVVYSFCLFCCLFIIVTWWYICMVPTGSDESKLRTFQGPFQDQISHYKDFYYEFHNADIPNTPHISGNFLLLGHHTWIDWISVLYFGGKLAKCAFWYRLLAKLIKCFISGID